MCTIYIQAIAEKEKYKEMYNDLKVRWELDQEVIANGNKAITLLSKKETELEKCLKELKDVKNEFKDYKIRMGVDNSNNLNDNKINNEQLRNKENSIDVDNNPKNFKKSKKIFV